jgi:hypothetical protein
MLASRLSRRDATLTVGALGGLLADDLARAGVPPELVRSTARAASLSTAGKAVAAGVVSAQVAALTGEVLKNMLLNKLKLTTAILLVTVALAAGGTSFAYRAHGTEPASQEKDSEKPRERSKPAEVVPEEIPPPDEQPKPAEPPKAEQPPRVEATKQDQPKSIEAPSPKQDQPKPGAASKEAAGRPKEPVAKEAEPAPLVEEQWERTNQRMLDCGGYSITATRTGRAAVAYNTATREVKVVRLNATSEQPLWVTPVAADAKKPQVDAKNPQLVALGVRGARITRVAVFNLKSGKWAPLNLDQPVDGAVWPMSIGPQNVAYEVGNFLYLFNPTTDAWDRIDLRTFGDDTQEPRATEVR